MLTFVSKFLFSSLIVSAAISSALAASAMTTSAPTGATSPLQEIKSFDGQYFACLAKSDVGRFAYRLRSASAVIKAGQVEITVGLETVKCFEHAGIFAFEKSELTGRQVNSRQGFAEFSTLELVGYTTDFKFVKSAPANLQSADQTLVFTAPVMSFASLMPRNVAGIGDRRITMLTFLRGQVSLGDVKTGQVQQRTSVEFGTNSFVLSEADGTLKFAL